MRDDRASRFNAEACTFTPVLTVADVYDFAGNALTAAGYPAAVALVLGEPPPPPIAPFTAAVLALYPLSADPTSASIELGAVDGRRVCLSGA
jgi:hypothetical protein